MLPEPNLRTPIAISLGAIAGALSRYYLSLWFLKTLGSGFPYGTFCINLTGCTAMGFLIALAAQRSDWIAPELRLLATVGFLGSYTTFSTYGLESLNLLRNALGTEFNPQNWLGLVLYWLGSAALGVLSVWLGMRLAQELP